VDGQCAGAVHSSTASTYEDGVTDACGAFFEGSQIGSWNDATASCGSHVLRPTWNCENRTLAFNRDENDGAIPIGPWLGNGGQTSMPKHSAARDCVAVGECNVSYRSRKNTKRWCHGDEGVEHVWTVVCTEWNDRQGDEHGYRGEHEVCATCGRERVPYWYWDEKATFRCHCGARMTSTGGRWRVSLWCPICRYRPSRYCKTEEWDALIAGFREVNTYSPCGCEIASNRERRRELHRREPRPASVA
jgi:hypothetical protein